MMMLVENQGATFTHKQVEFHSKLDYEGMMSLFEKDLFVHDRKVIYKKIKNELM